MNQLAKYVYFTFTLRRSFLFAVVVLGAMPSALLTSLPLEVKVGYAVGFVSLVSVSFYGLWGVYSGIAEQAIRMIWCERKYKPIPYFTQQVREMAKKMGIEGQVDVYVTENPTVTSAFTNMVTSRVGIPSSWVAQFPTIERLAIIAHELGHIKTRRIFFLEMMSIVGMIAAFTIVLVLVALPLYGHAAIMALWILLIGYLSRRNEFRADYEAAKAVSPEALISVFEQLALNVERDEGSETHPSFRARIKRLQRMLE